MPNSDLAGVLGVSELAPKAAPPAQTAGGDPAVWTILGEAGTDPKGWTAVASTIANRSRSSGKSAQDIVTDRDQGYEAWNDPAARSRTMQQYPVGSPAYQAAQTAVGGILSGQSPPPLGYTHFYSPKGQAALGRQPPTWEDGHGVDIGGNRFFTVGSGTGDLASMLGITGPDAAKVNALQTPPAAQPEGSKPGSGAVLVEGKPVTAAQEAWVKAHPDRIGGEAVGGTSALPFFLKPGGNIPQTPNSHYVDLDGVEHVVSGGVMGALESAGQGFMQGAGPDVLHSALKLTGGGLATAGVPFSAAPQGPDSDQQMREGALAAAARQAHDYSSAHMGDEAAQGGRFAGQAIPATAAAAAVPEVELPGAAATNALGMASRVAGRTGTNALRGVAATGPVVGPNDRPVVSQLATGALAGAALPPLFKGASQAGAAAMGLGGSATPEVAALARTAIEKYRIPLRSGQIAGVADRNAAYADSNLLAAPGSGTATNAAKQARAFTQAVARTVGLDTPNLSPTAMDTARRNIGSVFEGVANRSGVKVDDQLFHDLAQVGSQARELGLDQSQINALDLQIKKITDLAASHGEVIPGDAYQSVTQTGSSLSRIMKNDHGSFSDLASDIRTAVDDAVARGSDPADVAALQNARAQWRALKTIQPLAAKAGPDGLISPVALRARVMAQYPNFAFGEGGDLGELARIGYTFLREPPQSGTAPRLADMFRGAQGGGLAAGAIAGTLSHDPGIGISAALAPFALGTLRVGNNALRGVLNDNPVATGLLLRSGQAPGRVGGVLEGLGNVARPTQIPLSALGTDWLLNHRALPAPESPIQSAQ